MAAVSLFLHADEGALIGAVQVIAGELREPGFSAHEFVSDPLNPSIEIQSGREDMDDVESFFEQTQRAIQGEVSTVFVGTDDDDGEEEDGVWHAELGNALDCRPSFIVVGEIVKTLQTGNEVKAGLRVQMGKVALAESDAGIFLTPPANRIAGDINAGFALDEVEAREQVSFTASEVDPITKSAVGEFGIDLCDFIGFERSASNRPRISLGIERFKLFFARTQHPCPLVYVSDSSMSDVHGEIGE